MSVYTTQASNSGPYHAFATGAVTLGDGVDHVLDNHSNVAVDPSLDDDEQVTIAAIEKLKEGVSGQHDVDASQNVAQVASQAALAAAAAAAQKSQHQRRVPQACDACSMRKVKCDDQPQCKNCRDLNVPCTRERVRRRRGPPNKVKEQLEVAKRARTTYSQDLPGNVASPFAFGQTQTSTDLLATPEIISQLLGYFFTFVHPLHPFPNEMWLNQVYQRRADIAASGTHNPVLALIASMLAAVTALRPRQIIGLINSAGYSDAASFIHRARSICMSARGVDYLEQNDLDANSAATSYLLALTSAHTGQEPQCQRYLGEAVAILHGISDENQIDEQRKQTASRVYWAIFVLSRYFDMLDQPVVRLKTKMPYEPVLPRPDLVADELIHADGIINIVEAQPQDSFPALALSGEVDLFIAVSRYLKGSPTLDGQELFPRDVPDLISAPATARQTTETVGALMQQLINTSVAERTNGDGSYDVRKEIQRAHYMLTSLLIRAHAIDQAVEEINNGSVTQSVNTNQVLSLEREHVARGLMFLLADIPAPALEPDAVGFMDNVRQILNTLFRDPKILASYGAALQGFEGIFSRIAAYNGVWNDAEDFDNQADLKARQEEFAASDLGQEISRFS